MSTITAPRDAVKQHKDRPRYHRLSELSKVWGKHPSAFTRYILNPKTDRRNDETFTLEAIKTPGEWLVPEGAVEAYFARITASRTGAHTPVPTSTQVNSARQRELDRVDRELEKAGFRVNTK